MRRPAGLSGGRGVPGSSAQVGARERARDCRGIRGCARGLGCTCGAPCSPRGGALAGCPGGCGETRGAHRFRFRRAAPPRAPSAGAGDQSRAGGAGGPLPSASPPQRLPSPEAPLVQRKPALQDCSALRRMRFWLRHEEMALEEMVQRLNAVSKRTGRRSRRPQARS